MGKKKGINDKTDTIEKVISQNVLSFNYINLKGEESDDLLGKVKPIIKIIKFIINLT